MPDARASVPSTRPTARRSAVSNVAASVIGEGNICVVARGGGVVGRRSGNDIRRGPYRRHTARVHNHRVPVALDAVLTLLCDDDANPVAARVDDSTLNIVGNVGVNVATK